MGNLQVDCVARTDTGDEILGLIRLGEDTERYTDWWEDSYIDKNRYIERKRQVRGWVGG